MDHFQLQISLPLNWFLRRLFVYYYYMVFQYIFFTFRIFHLAVKIKNSKLETYKY